jgi:DNA topoisomerase-3
MSNTIYLCEKPSQARDIARILGAAKRGDGYITGNGVTVTWCLGHLLELAPPDNYCHNLKPWRMEVLPVIPDKWQVQPVVKTKKQFKNLFKIFSAIA